MKILLFGKNGQVGWELQRSLAPLGEVIALGSTDANFSHLQNLQRTIRAIAPDVIVNAAAYTAVDQAQSEPDLCRAVNALAPAVLAQEARRLDAWLVHYSSDYVFSGAGTTPWRETDSPAPLNVYGQAKLQGDQAIQASGCQHLIFRTSWVYGLHGNNFVKTILRLAQERDQLQVINDQVGAPTGAELIADISAKAIGQALRNKAVSGLYHLAPSGDTSWHAYAKLVIEHARQAGVDIKVAEPAIASVPSSAFATLVTRPKNSRLNTDKLQKTFGFAMPDWQPGVFQMLQKILHV